MTAFQWALLCKDSHFVLPEPGELVPKHSGDAPSISIIMKAVYLVGAIKCTLILKKSMEWTTLKYVPIS